MSRPSLKGPHQVSSVEQNSPAMFGGLKPDDLILKVNDVNVVGERYNKTISLIKNESQNGRLKLEVIDSENCPTEIKNTPLLQSKTEIDLENFEIVTCTLHRKENYPSHGLCLGMRSYEDVPVTIITKVASNSPSEECDLKVGDLVLEIDGRTTNGLPNKTIARWLLTVGPTFQLLVGREKVQLFNAR
jgi:C-terminal processing protease CtpA/Prc